MSILTGLLHDRGTLASEPELRGLSLSTEQYATGASVIYVRGRLGMSFQPYVSHERSVVEGGPRVDIHENVLSFDGRLDNYDELADALGLDRVNASDSTIVLSAFERWGEECFSRFTGDWAIALWSDRGQRLFLARDHAGTRTLYYQRQPQRVLWSTYLEPFLHADAELRLSEQYAACYLACLPIRGLTPYEGICSVLPGQYVAFDDCGVVQRSHWSAVITNTIRHKSDVEYEDHFFALFRQAVARRTGPGAPILAQLSGGMDSTSIVCMSDHIRRSVDPDSEILDTLSYFDDSEASLDERRYFTITETRRGKSGIHLDAAFSQRTFDPPCAKDGVYLFPGADSFSLTQERKLFEFTKQSGYRTILSGIGGDEVLGGVPNALPELADHLFSGDLPQLFRQSLAWCLVDRSPMLATLYTTVRYSPVVCEANAEFDKATTVVVRTGSPLCSRFRCARRITCSSVVVASHQLDNASAWWFIMETLPHATPQARFRPEYRYPMLDKDLVNYLYSIPREQILRPGRRRSLMRRALRDIIPAEILERRRKAYQLRAPLDAIGKAYTKLHRVLQTSAVAETGLVDGGALLDELRRTATGSGGWYQALLRTIAYELWLQASYRQGLSKLPARPHRVLHPSLAAL